MKRSQEKVREFALYGESAGHGTDLHLHIEDIQVRARRYHWEIAPHRHAALCQCLFLARGPAEIHVDDVDAEVMAPALVIVPPGTVHAFRFSAETGGFVLTLPSATIAEGAERELRELMQGVFAESFVASIEDAALASRLEGLFERLLAEFREPEAGAAPVTGWLANSILWVLARHVAHARLGAARATTRQRSWLKFRALAEAHFHEQWNISRYARQLGMTTTRLNRLCREQCGLTASQVLQKRLALEARRRLIYVDVPIALLAAELGFRDPAYFCRFFKRHAGASPRTFRRHALSRRIGLSSAAP
jgi:AraC family transcriptional activator of pobA